MFKEGGPSPEEMGIKPEEMEVKKPEEKKEEKPEKEKTEEEKELSGEEATKKYREERIKREEAKRDEEVRQKFIKIIEDAEHSLPVRAGDLRIVEGQLLNAEDGEGWFKDTPEEKRHELLDKVKKAQEENLSARKRL